MTRASRQTVIRAAARRGARVRMVWLDTPLAEAQRNAIERMLEAHGRLLDPAELAPGRGDPTRLAPRVLWSQSREMEPPEEDEGFHTIERVAFQRRPSGGGGGLAVALEALTAVGPPILERGEAGPRLVFAWLPDGGMPTLSVETAVCPHAAGPARCWCRPPLPGLLLAFAYRHRIDPAKLLVIGTSAAHRNMAAAAGARFVPAL